MKQQHVVLLGDSIFDNGVYVPGELSVVEQLREELSSGGHATLLAVDGDVIDDVEAQLRRVPMDATHLVISVGGNDALGHADILNHIRSMEELHAEIEAIAGPFQASYEGMLANVVAQRLPTAVCTIYDQCPFPERKWRELIPIALGRLNALIIEAAEKQEFAVLELRDICSAAEDFSTLSPIEPSAIGGLKIVRAIVDWLNGIS